MDPAIKSLVDISGSEASLRASADMMLERARWAGEMFQRYDRARTFAIAEAVAEAAHAKAGEYAEWAVRETGFGVVAHKKLKNEQTSTFLVEHYRDWDFVNPRLDATARIVEIPRPAGVVFALTPSTNPVSTIYFKALIALMTRNAMVISPHPAARACCWRRRAAVNMRAFFRPADSSCSRSCATTANPGSSSPCSASEPRWAAWR